ncbi:pyridoxal-phosphate dependent enzyme [Rhizobium sp. GCM10022189]|uniref:pyridoxal-phosphate dependent enzyme n=1 Tax=Rhizobium sp. GCM10022189 TaxID=3252654 RepID=UPI0036238297
MKSDTYLQSRPSAPRYRLNELVWRCEQTGLPLEILGRDTRFSRHDIDGRNRSLWRYQRSLIHQGSLAVSLGEGLTPLVHDVIDGVNVFWKCEFTSVSGSFKDRGVSVLLNHLLASGATAIAGDSTGNYGASLTAYATAARVPCRIYVPSTTSPANVTKMAAAGAQVIRVDGTTQAAADAAMTDRDYFYAGYNWHPAFIDGVKTVGYEIWEQLGFEAPDAIIAPAGGGSNILGCYRAFNDLLRSSEIRSLPRLYGAQSENCSPIADAFALGLPNWTKVTALPTLAEAIAIADPVRGNAVLAAIRQSQGASWAVEDRQLEEARAELSARGPFVELTSASAYVLLKKLLAAKKVRPGERVVVILTGSGMKPPIDLPSAVTERKDAVFQQPESA